MFYGFIEVRGRCLSIIGGNLNLLPCKCAMRGILYRTRGGGSRPPLPPPTPARRTPEWGVSDSPPPHPLYGTRPPAYGEPPGGPLFGPSNLNGRCDRSGPGMSVRHSCHFLRTQRDFEASVIDILANSKIRLNSVKRMTQIQNTS